MELTLNIDCTKITLQPGETLAVTIKSDDLDSVVMSSLKQNLQGAFPDNKVIVFGVGGNDSVNFSTIQFVSSPEQAPSSGCGTEPANYCSDCNCGKKAAYESSN